jgi:undecaprenyl-phosphate galactose phosphotransferase/putative colanic acid biosynthesis UDP-glucose lipid carrier transferase
MPNGKSKYLFIPILFGDILILTVSFGIVCYFSEDGLISVFDYISKMLVASGLWIFVVLKRKIYDIPRFLLIEKILMVNIESLAVFFCLNITILFFLSPSGNQRWIYLNVFVIFSILQLTWHLLILLQIKRMRVKGLNYRKVLLVGMNLNMEAMIRKIESTPDIGYQIAGIFTNANPNNLALKYFKGRLDEVTRFCKENHIHHMFVSLPHHQSTFINDLIHFCDNNLIRVKIIPEFSEYLSQSFYIDYVDHTPILKFREEPLESLSNKLVKRSFDLVFSIFVLVFIFSWLLPVVAICIKVSSPGPIFFVQERSGKRGDVFKCLKFRSMRVNQKSNVLQATRDDNRITSIGKFLRRTSLDEFPQFINVFKGEMSVVGPRPHMLKHTEVYGELINKFMVRHLAKPGITGWAQINGLRGETKKVEDMRKRAEADIWYLENWSILLDIKIIILTAWNILIRKDENAY